MFPYIDNLNKITSQVKSDRTFFIQRINRTNSSTMLEDNLSISEALAQRDSLQLKKGIYDSVIQTAASRQDRYGRSEIKYLSVTTV